MGLDRDSLTPLKRTILELALILGLGSLAISTLAMLGATRDTLFVVCTWVAGLLGMWMLIALFDLIMRNFRMHGPAQEERKGGYARKRGINHPIFAPHPHPEITHPERPHGRRKKR